MAAAGSAFEHTVDMGISCEAFNRAWLALTAVSEVEAMLFYHWLFTLAMCVLIMPRCACASEVYGSVCRLLQLLKDQ